MPHGLGLAMRIGWFSVQRPLGTRPGIGTQPSCKTPGGLWGEYVKTWWLIMGEWGCPLDNGLNLATGQPNSI